MGRLRALVVLARVVRDRRWPELREAVEAQLALVRAQIVLWTRRRGAFVPSDSSTELSTGSEEQRIVCERLARAVLRAARYGIFRPRCLARAIALSNLLAAHGIRGHQIRIGVGRENGAFVAHAWVERGPWILGDTATHTGSYVPLTDVRLLPRFSA